MASLLCMVHFIFVRTNVRPDLELGCRPKDCSVPDLFVPNSLNYSGNILSEHPEISFLSAFGYKISCSLYIIYFQPF